MKGLILGAGKGTRMREVSDVSPKVLLNILDKPMIVWNIDLLRKYGVKDIAINTHYMADKIKEYLGDGSKFGVKINYSYEPELLGTSGSLNNFKDFFADETFVVKYGDVISQIDLSKIIAFHNAKKGAATLVVHKTDHPEDTDIVVVDKESRIKGFIHNPGSREYGDLGSTAFYIVEPKIFEYLPEGKSDFIQDIFTKMIENGESLYAYVTEEFSKDAGTPERIKQVEDYLKSNMK